MTAVEVTQALKALSSPEKAKASAWFFKTGPGQYGEGDEFIGVTVPEQRQVAKRFKELPLTEIEKLLNSRIHEHRLTALIILVGQFARGDEANKKAIYDFYLAHTACINNWDLVDSSASQIVGAYLVDRDKQILVKLAGSHNLWERRIAVVSTLAFIAKGEPDWSFKIADLLMSDTHDLIYKATGWMLREVGKKCGREVLVQYLATRYQTMPRTMLRYSIEHFSPEERQKYLKGLV